jgi:hypothetical protein
MIFEKLERAVKTPIITLNQIKREFAEESAQGILTQLTRWVKKGQLLRLKRGVYKFAERSVDDLAVAPYLYEPSYISLESALQIHGLLPDIPAVVTSVTTVTPNTFTTPMGVYSFSRIDTSLFFGFSSVLDETSGLAYRLALPEKAILDWIYIRKIKEPREQRLEMNSIKRDQLLTYAQEYPGWVRERLYE